MANETDKRVTVLFGAGTGAEIWLRRWRKESDSYLIIDNDSRLWGSERYGVGIASPASIQNCDYEKIIIVFSHVHEARGQLLALAVHESAIEVPPKSAFRPQPFRTAAKRLEALAALRRVLGNLSDAGVNSVVEQGAALGLYRDGDLIAWDNDIDIGVPRQQSSNLVDQFAASLHRAADAHETLIKEHDEGVLVSWLQGKNCIPFAVYTRQDVGSCAVSMDAAFHSVDVSVWWPPRSHLVGGFAYPLPARPDEYLTQIYGSDWKTPKSQYTFEDYPQASIAKPESAT